MMNTFYTNGSGGALGAGFNETGIVKVGEPLGNFYGYVFDGIYQNEAEAKALGLTKDDVGSVKFKDLNGDGYITEDDRTVIGNTNPKVQGGFGLSGQWKGFDFAMNFNFMLDFDVNNATAYQLSSSESNKNKFYNVLSTFADKGWRYTRDGDGECLYKCYYIDGSLDMYRELNEGRTLWNPTDVTKKTNSIPILSRMDRFCVVRI